MQGSPNLEDHGLAGLTAAEWRARLEQTALAHGDFDDLDAAHCAAFIEAGDTLLVSFETRQGIRALSDNAQPLGWDMVRREGWSHLCMISDGDTWFRAPQVYDYFDRLADDGFFDAFERVVFYGAGPCGYAAAAFSVAAPGAHVLAIQPQATLDPAVAGWDQRFVEQRRRDFAGRYGYAPDMLDAAAQGFILFDPMVTMDAMHAALFTRPNVTKLPMRHFGVALQTHLMEMQIIAALLGQAGSGTLSALSFARLLRARRDYAPYLRTLMGVLDAEGRDPLTEMLCRNVTARMKAPKFTRRLRELASETEVANEAAGE